MSMNFLQHRNNLFSGKKQWKHIWRSTKHDNHLYYEFFMNIMTGCTLPHRCKLIFHFKRSQAPVDWVQYFVALVTASPSIEAGDDDPVWAGEVRAPVQLEAIVHPLTTGATVPAQVINSILSSNVDDQTTNILWIILRLSAEECCSLTHQ